IFKNGFQNPNTALLNGLNFIDDTLAAHTARQSGSAVAPGPSRPAPGRPAENEAGGSSIFGWICLGLFVLAAFWVVEAIFRAISGGGRSGGYAGGAGPAPAGAPGYAAGPAGGGGGGGGGFMSGLFGGLFGAVAGNWIYNTMFGGSSYHQSAWGAPSAFGN